MWCVGELGLEYTRHDAGHTYGVVDGDQFFDLNPNRTVPVLQDNSGPVIWETGAIIRYLATRYGSGPFWPENAVERAVVDMWAEWAKINVAMGFTSPVFWRVVRTPETEQDPRAIADALAALKQKLAIADQRLGEHDWLCGPDFTLADIQFGHILYRYFDIEIERPDWRAIPRYFDRIMQRNAYVEHVAISYEELRNSLPE